MSPYQPVITGVKELVYTKTLHFRALSYDAVDDEGGGIYTYLVFAEISRLAFYTPKNVIHVFPPRLQGGSVYIYLCAKIFFNTYTDSIFSYALFFVWKYVYRLISSFLMFLRLFPQTSPKNSRLDIGGLVSPTSPGDYSNIRVYTRAVPEDEVWRRKFLVDPTVTPWKLKQYMDVSENRGSPKSSILIGLSIINHPFWGTPIFGNTHMIQNE